MKKPLALIILDGFGENPESTSNAILSANTPNLDRLRATYPLTTLDASGMSVGLPDGQMGNSEVGHTTIGAGRIVYQELTKISKSIADGEFDKNNTLLKAMEQAKDKTLHIMGLLSDGGVHSHMELTKISKSIADGEFDKNNTLLKAMEQAKDKTLHIMGLLSDGGVHSHIEHLYGILRLAKKSGVKNVYIHCFMDGRDVAPTSGVNFVKALLAEIDKIGIGKIATISGRYYAMDRDNRWDRVEKAFLAVSEGVGERASSPVELLESSYKNGVTDEFIVPTVIDTPAPMQSGDSVIFFNFRPDRARELTRAIVDESFSQFARPRGHIQLGFVCMTQYDAAMPNVSVAFPPQGITNTFGEYISKKGLTQLRIAETEKYAHVTFFFNAGIEQPYENEDRILVSSPNVATYDMQPEMSAYEVTDKAVDAVNSGKYDCIILNYANCDMVGHTGVFDAAVKAVEAVDECLGRFVDAVLKAGGIALITADHGNADQMLDGDTPMTAHTTAPVIFMVAGGNNIKLRDGGILADIAPTMLKLLELPQPAEMTGKSIIV